MAAAKPPEPPPELVVTEAPKKPGRPLLLYGAVALVGLVVLGAGGWFLVPKFLGTRPPAAEAKVEEPVKATVPLGAVVVNLTGEPRRYLRAAVHVGVPSAKEIKEVDEAKPQILDLLINVLSSADVETLTSEEGRTELKEELLARIREELGLQHISRIYFTEFVIQ